MPRRGNCHRMSETGLCPGWRGQTRRTLPTRRSPIDIPSRQASRSPPPADPANWVPATSLLRCGDVEANPGPLLPRRGPLNDARRGPRRRTPRHDAARHEGPANPRRQRPAERRTTPTAPPHDAARRRTCEYRPHFIISSFPAASARHGPPRGDRQYLPATATASARQH